MFRGKSICVVVPAYNEEKLIGRVVDTMPDFVDRIVIVDDCSTDGTVQVVEALATAQPDRILLVRHEKNQGVGGAIVTGYLKARELRMGVTVVMAGDAQMDPEDLPALLDPVVEGRADYAKGNRLFTGEAWETIPRVRYLGNAVLSLLTKIASGYWHIADSQTGYTAANLAVLDTLPFRKVFRNYGVPNDLLVRLNVFNFRVIDVPVKPVYGIGEKSGIRIGLVIPRISWLLIRLFLWRMKEKYIIRDFHPLIFFYLLGLLCVPTGALMGVYLAWLRLFHGPVAPVAPLFAAFLFITGLQSIFFAMWFDMEYNRDLGLGAHKETAP